MRIKDQEIINWLKTFSSLVRNRQQDEARVLFSGQCSGFGTVVNFAQGLDELVEEQWDTVWPITQDFEFDYGSATCHQNQLMTVITVLWSSHGISEKGLFLREGRATILLSREEGSLKALHTHFSFSPRSAQS